MSVIVDTNVAIAANGRDTHANLDCQLRCVTLLEEVVAVANENNVVVDDLGLMLDEYARHLSYAGQPGTGDMFFKFLHDNLYGQQMIQQVTVTPNTDATRGFDELPPNSVDPSDRKFLATAVASGALIINALDTDWHEKREFIEQVGVEVQQVCPEHGCVVPQ
ncbi:hypothetical protein [Burkholderia ambifaria]|uniref:hypothetical protein n=1 Tax=Burkholderia ambifaria TaxID=152480 RepID=UPI001589F82A|nr:hypothetical protein [Burkholderia ambifaria]